MNRAVPWILAVLFALLLAISLLTRRGPERLVSPKAESVTPAEVASTPLEPVIPPAEALQSVQKKNHSPEAPREEKDFSFDSGRPISDQIREELKKRYIGKPPSMVSAVGEHLDEVLPVLTEILKDPAWGPYGRYRAAYLLLEHNAPGTKEILDSLLTDKKVRKHVVGFLAKHGDESSAQKMVEVYDDSDGLTQDGIIRSMAFLGHAEGMKLVDQALKERAKDIPGLLADLSKKNGQVFIEDALYGIESERRELEFYRQAITAAASDDPGTAAVPALYHEELYAKDWGLHILSKERPPTLALHLRAAMDVQKTRSVHRRSFDELWFERDLLKLLEETGGTLTPSEKAFLKDFGKPGCMLPKPSE